MPAFARADRSYVRQLRRVVGQGSRTSGERPTESGSRREDFSSSNWCSAHAPPPKSFSKKSRSHDCVSELRFPKSEINPQVCWSLLLLYPSFSGAAAGQFQPEQPWEAAQAEVSTLSTISTDSTRSGW